MRFCEFWQFLLYKSPIQGGNKGFRGVLTFFRIACIYEKTPTVYFKFCSLLFLIQQQYQHEDRYYEYYPNYVRPKRQRNVTDYYNYNLEDNIEDEQAGSEDNQDDDEIIGDPLFISYNVTFSEEATNDGLPFLSTNSQNLPIDNLNSQDQTVSPKNLQKSAKKNFLEVCFGESKQFLIEARLKKKHFLLHICTCFCHI